MPTYSYLTTSNFNSSRSMATNREGIGAYAERHGLRIDREFVEQPGDFFVDRLNGDWRAAPLADRPIGKQLCELLRPGDSVVVWQPMLEPTQVLAFAKDLQRRGIALHLAKLGFDATGPLFLAALGWLISASKFIEAGPRSEGTKAGMARAKARGGARGSRPAPGWRHVQSADGSVRRVPDAEQRSVMNKIVELRLAGWGWRRIASWLAKERVMWKKRDRAAPRGYTLEFWCPRRCQRAYEEMMANLIDEQTEKTRAAIG